MRTILTMAIKDLTLMRRDWLGLFFIIGFPVIMGLFFGMIAGSFGSEGVSFSIAVVDEDDTDISKKFLDDLEANENVTTQKLSRDEAFDRVRRGKLVGVIVVPEGFGETAGIFWADGPAIQIGTDPSRIAEAGMLQGMVMESVGKLIAVRIQDPSSMRPFIEDGKRQLEQADDLPPLVKPVLIQLMGSLDTLMDSMQNVQETADASDGESGFGGFQFARVESIDLTRQFEKGSTGELVRKIRSKWDISFPQAMLWGVLGCAAGFAITMVRERILGTYLRLQIAPVRRGQVLAGKALACFLAILLVILLMVILGVTVGMRPESPWLLVLAGLSVAFCFSGVMMLMSVIGKSEEAVSGAAWFANVMMAMFGGGMLPLAFMPKFMTTLSNFSPGKWSILAVEGAIWRGLTLSEMMLPVGVLVGCGVVCFVIGVGILSRDGR